MDPLLGHNPPCSSWEEHVERAYAALTDLYEYTLPDFVDFLIHTRDNELLVADPERPGAEAAA